MLFLRKKLESSPELPRIAPFGIYALLGVFQTGEGDSRYWYYIIKTFLGAWMLWEVRPLVLEMRWKVSWEAIVIGIGIFVIWVGLDGYYPRLTKLDAGANPFAQFGAGSAMAWFYIAVHLIGLTFIVPPVEEIFYRSFMYRYFVNTNFLAMPLNQYHPLSFFVTSIIFGVMHPDRWLPGIICGLAYQWLVLKKNRLGDAMTAHAVTNCLLGLWIVWKHDWSFW
jgi:CAAX prenyl protease-like protein